MVYAGYTTKLKRLVEPRAHRERTRCPARFGHPVHKGRLSFAELHSPEHREKAIEQIAHDGGPSYGNEQPSPCRPTRGIEPGPESLRQENETRQPPCPPERR